LKAVYQSGAACCYTGGMRPPLVYVLVINWNGLEHLEECFASLLACPYPSIRFFLIDNASTDGSVAFVRDRFGSDERVVVLQCPRNLGWSGGNNVGLRRALEDGADYAFLLNNDTATAPDAIPELVATAEARPEIGALAPKMLLFDQPFLLNSLGLECSIIASSWDRGLGRVDGPHWDLPGQTIGVCGGAWFLRAAALRKTGLLPEDFDIYLDDLDLCLRLWDGGYEVWTCPAARVRHKFGATYGQGERARRKYFLSTRNRFRLMLRNFPWSRMAACFPAIVLGECRAVGRALLDKEYWRAGLHARAWLDAPLYVPHALAERARRRRAGLVRGRFWPLVRRRPLFCPRIPLPERGWYPEIAHQGRRLRPMSARAWEEVPPGRLRLLHGNCYPALGPTEVVVRAEGAELARLSTTSLEETRVEARAGRLEFESRRVFTAQETGAEVDLGGWIGIERLDTHE